MKICDWIIPEWFTDCDGGGDGRILVANDDGVEPIDPAVPEPTAAILFGAAALLIGVRNRWRK